MGRAEALLERGRQLVCLLWKASGVCLQGPAQCPVSRCGQLPAPRLHLVLCVWDQSCSRTRPQAWFSRDSPRGVQCHPHPFCWLYISHSQVQSLHVRTQAAVTIWLKGPLSVDGVSASQLAGWFRLGWRQSEPVSGYLPAATCHTLSYTWALGTEMLSVTPGNNKRAQQITTDHAWLSATSVSGWRLQGAAMLLFCRR